MAHTHVDRLHEEHKALVAFLSTSGQLSFIANADSGFRKVLLIAAASYFERVVRTAIIDLCRERTTTDEMVMSLIHAKAIERQYHTYFDWKELSAAPFFALFGRGFKDFMKQRVKADNQLADSIKAFLVLGSERNKLVHEDYAAYALDQTVDEIYTLYQAATYFADRLPQTLREYQAAVA